MRLFSKLLSRKPSWMYDAGGTVWKLMYTGDVLLGDARDVAKHTAAFFALEIATGNVLWRGVALPQPWWIGMQTVVGDTLLLHGFEKPDMPIPKGMHAVDVRSGAVRWSDENLTYLFTASERVYAQRASFREKIFYEIDPRTGAVLYDYGTNEEGIMQLRAVATIPDDPGAVFAESLHTRDASLRERVERSVDLSGVRGTVDVAEVDDLTVVSYHVAARGAEAMLDNRVMNKLHVLGPSGKILFDDTLAADAPAPVPDVFFVKDGVLLYVKDTTHVTGVRLADLH